MSRSIRVPIWTSGGRGPRVLVEEADFAKHSAIERLLESGGFSVLWCQGPEKTDDRCALAEHHECAAVADADVVLHTLRPHDPRNAEVLRNIIARYPETPVVVEAPKPLVDRDPDTYVDCTVVYQPMTATSLAEAIDSALRTATPDRS